MKWNYHKNSNLSFLIWYRTLFFTQCNKKRLSSKERQRQLGLKRYEYFRAVVYKLRKALDKREDKYTLEGMKEKEEGYFTIEASEQEHKKKHKEVKPNLML